MVAVAEYLSCNGEPDGFCSARSTIPTRQGSITDATGKKYRLPEEVRRDKAVASGSYPARFFCKQEISAAYPSQPRISAAIATVQERNTDSQENNTDAAGFSALLRFVPTDVSDRLAARFMGLR